jgi:CMP-N-acetylneuraminic acid synthetase
MNVAIIPARGGSKGVPGKNLRLLAGAPLLWYTVAAALSAKAVAHTVITTEDDEIAKYTTSLGVMVLRHPAELSTDTSPTYPVVKWAVQELLHSGINMDSCTVLRATTPLRSSDDIDNAIDLLLRNPEADSVVSVRPTVGIHPIRLKRVLDDGRLIDAFLPEGNMPIRRQELETLYLRNGGIYVAKKLVVETIGLWGSHCLAYIMPEDRSVNINTEFDFRVAELLMRDQLRSGRESGGAE